MKVLVADDHPLVREGIENILRRINLDLCLLEANGFVEAVSVVEQHHQDLDLALFDLSMPGMKGAKSVRELRQLMPCTPIAIVSASEDMNDIRQAINNGANGYIPKSSSNKVMLSALQLILSGGLYLPPQCLKTPLDPKQESLTSRQRELLRLLVVGKTNKEIACDLAISDKTVKAHLSEIFKRLGASNRTQAVHRVLSDGLLDMPR
ncbi:Two-component transcriptional response regulator, LuxR family [hydrothermal vent metagenome]|uniref:Two-component transcriptional response regulator, LuxR family n=1 Tax=hydrothermal vent metagenome TaxID=652676 RepID=A0A3B0YSQ0_9ZZZZ